MTEPEGSEEELLRRRAELEEQIEFLRRHEESDGLAAVKAEGERIIAAREAELARKEAAREEPLEREEPPAEPVEMTKSQKKRRRRKLARAARRAEREAKPSRDGSSAGSATVVSAAHRSFDPSDGPAPYRLVREDGSVEHVSRADRDVGPGAHRGGDD